MRQPVCSPRLQNLLDIARLTVSSGQVDPYVVARFTEALAEEPQRGAVDFGRGLCGRRGRRLGTSLPEVDCEDCLELLGQGLEGPKSA